MVKTILAEEAEHLQSKWMVSAGTIVVGVVGLVLAIAASPQAVDFFAKNGGLVGCGLVLVSAIVFSFTTRRKRR